MEEIWINITRLINQLAPQLVEELNSGASDNNIERLEEALGLFPEQLVQSLRIHDGQLYGIYPLMTPWRLCMHEEIIKNTQRLREQFPYEDFEEGQEARGPVKSDVWNQSWVPFASDDMGNYLCIDLDPPDEGHQEQVILWASDPPYVEVIAPSYRVWLEQFANDLKSGKYKWDQENSEWSRVE
jgi:cell wall assembly regulator SMI1